MNRNASQSKPKLKPNAKSNVQNSPYEAKGTKPFKNPRGSNAPKTSAADLSVKNEPKQASTTKNANTKSLGSLKGQNSTQAKKSQADDKQKMQKEMPWVIQ